MSWTSKDTFLSQIKIRNQDAVGNAAREGERTDEGANLGREKKETKSLLFLLGEIELRD